MLSEGKNRDFLMLALLGAIGLLTALMLMVNMALHARTALWSYLILGLLLLALGGLTLLMVLTCIELVRLNRGSLKSEAILKRMRDLLHSIYPALYWVAQLFRISKDALNRSYIQYNNRIVESLVKPVPPNRLLLLLPHCLQWNECSFKVSGTGERCAECGRCPVGDFRGLSKRYGVPVVIATGGTLARKAIQENQPQLILAVACERDLAAGIYDARKLPVIGVLNERPEGPCRNTLADTDYIGSLIERYTVRSRSDV